VTSRKCHNSFAPAKKKWIWGDHYRVGSLLSYGCKGCIDIAFTVGVQEK